MLPFAIKVRVRSALDQAARVSVHYATGWYTAQYRGGMFECSD